MNAQFAEHIANLPEQLKVLIAAPKFCAPDFASDLPAAGVYLFSEGATHIYVGRSNNLSECIRNHGREDSASSEAPLAYQMAREDYEIKWVLHPPKASEEEYFLNDLFQKGFRNAKARIRQMDVRVLTESHSIRRVLFEAYAAIALKIPYTDFDIR
jgi:hypothetical protein